MDLNDYACALARARLVMTAAELAGVSTLAEAAKFHPHVYWADGLEQVERDEVKPSLQFGLFEKVEEKPRATLTRADVRAELRKVFAEKFQAVVANPPYITEKDNARKEYHRENIGKTRRYLSSSGKYSLASPFIERCFQLSADEGHIGVITGNNFIKRDFGKSLIEEVLSAVDISLVVDASQAYIPFHGTPTVLLFARNRRPTSSSVRAVMGKRGETGTPSDPAHGRVWSSIVEGWNQVGFENEFVSVTEIARKIFDKHPWSLGGGGASVLKSLMEKAGAATLGEKATDLGFSSYPGTDDAFVMPDDAMRRLGIPEKFIRKLCPGDAIRDWASHSGNWAIAPYDSSFSAVSEEDLGTAKLYFWRLRTTIRSTIGFGGRTRGQTGEPHWTWYRWIPGRLRIPLSLAFAFVATHNHFVLERGDKVFKRSAPVIKLPSDATEDEHLVLLGLLNSSAACFWMKQVFHCKGSQGVNEGMKSSLWEQFFEFDSTKLKLFPVPPKAEQVREYAQALDALATNRVMRSASALLLGADAWTNAQSLRAALDRRAQQDTEDYLRMIALQEELDWLCYELYEIDRGGKPIPVQQVDPLPPTWLPWLLKLATRDAEIRAMLGRDEDPEELPTVWFERHGWAPLTELPPEAPKALRARTEARRLRVAASPALTLIESPNFKRRWYHPDHAAEEKTALELWLAERVEAVAKDRARPFTLEQIVASLQDDPRTLAVCEVLTARRDFNLSALVANALSDNTVPSHSLHIYKPSGLVKARSLGAHVGGTTARRCW
jgi:hypothetical protein